MGVGKSLIGVGKSLMGGRKPPPWVGLEVFPGLRSHPGTGNVSGVDTEKRDRAGIVNSHGFYGSGQYEPNPLACSRRSSGEMCAGRMPSFTSCVWNS
jgi:hypothetical protein